MNTADPKLLLIIGPTAVGKSTLIERALVDFSVLEDIVTYTARPMRAGESEGHPYHFISEERFKELIAQGFFIEWALVHGRHYGVGRDQIQTAHTRSKILVVDINVQGAKTVMREFATAVSVFIQPPAIDALRNRFIKRGITDHEDLARRLKSAELELAQACDFHHIIINDDFDSAYGQLRKIIEKLEKNQ